MIGWGRGLSIHSLLIHHYLSYQPIQSLQLSIHSLLIRNGAIGEGRNNRNFQFILYWYRERSSSVKPWATYWLSIHSLLIPDRRIIRSIRRENTLSIHSLLIHGSGRKLPTQLPMHLSIHSLLILDKEGNVVTRLQEIVFQFILYWYSRLIHYVNQYVWSFQFILYWYQRCLAE